MADKEFTQEEQSYLLQVVKGDGNIEPLTYNHSYMEISDEINRLIASEYADIKDGTLKITDKGLKRLNKLHRSLKRRKNGWIEPKIDEKIEKIEENDIYLPSNIKKLKRQKTHQQ